MAMTHDHKQELGVNVIAAIRVANAKFQVRRYANEQIKTQDNMMFQSTEPTPIDGAHIHNAGLVLLWPFLRELFQRIGYTNDEGFISDVHRNRAMCLIEFLATELNQPQDIDMSLNKILCGARPEEPVISDLTITEDEISTVNSLLESVISHWPVLGNTSIDGLRESFLIRSGKLSFSQQSYNLTVEKAACDVLLDHLPWGIGLIKLSWMDKSLFVKWR